MKRIIWSSKYRLDNEKREYFQNIKRDILENESYEVSDNEWANEVCSWLENERLAMKKEIDGVIIAFGNLRLWDGRKNGYKILSSNIADILRTECDEAEWYSDGDNIRARLIHSDGTSYILYRVAKNYEDAERIGRMIYNYEIDEDGFCKETCSLYPYVANVYGWKESESLEE